MEKQTVFVAFFDKVYDIVKGWQIFVILLSISLFI